VLKALPSDKGLASGTHKELSTLTCEKPSKTWTKDLNEKGYLEQVNKCNHASLSLAMGELHIKATMRYHHKPNKMAKIKSADW